MHNGVHVLNPEGAHSGQAHITAKQVFCVQLCNAAWHINCFDLLNILIAKFSYRLEGVSVSFCVCGLKLKTSWPTV